MRIGVVAHEMEGQRTGVGRYLETLLFGARELSQNVPVHWTLFFRGAAFDHPLWCETSNIETVFDDRSRDHLILWEQLRLPRLVAQAGIDLLFSPSYSLPGRPAGPSVVTMHDLSFLHRGRDLGWKERFRRRWLAKRAIRHADLVIADTQAVAAEIAETYSRERDRIAVVPIAIEGRFDPQPQPADQAWLDRFGIPEEYLLFVGSILPRRPLRPLLQAFAQYLIDSDRSTDLRLVLAGSNRLPNPSNLGTWIGEAGLENRVLQLGYVPEEALPALYRRANLTLYPSEYEGYGLPPLESLACGTPCIVGSGLALDDLWPDYPYRAKSLEAKDLQRTLSRALADPNRQAIARQGLERVRRLTSRECAARLLEEFGRAIVSFEDRAR